MGLRQGAIFAGFKVVAALGSGHVGKLTVYQSGRMQLVLGDVLFEVAPGLLEELDVQAVIALRPEVVVIDEMAHTNIEGSKHEKRWQDVLDMLEAGISVISAINIQHLESLNEDVKRITGIDVQERVPDSVLAQADEVVNIDLTSDELIARLKEGKIYHQDKIETALKNFFKFLNTGY